MDTRAGQTGGLVRCETFLAHSADGQHTVRILALHVAQTACRISSDGKSTLETDLSVYYVTADGTLCSALPDGSFKCMYADGLEPLLVLRT